MNNNDMDNKDNDYKIKKDQLVKDFTSTSMDLVSNVTKIAPKSTVGKNYSTIKGILKDHDNQQKAIEMFVAKVLIYKEQIMKGDDEFFLNKSYNEDLDEYEMTDSVFEFKDIWKELNKKNKSMIKKYMQLLCMLGEEYFLLIDNN